MYSSSDYTSDTNTVYAIIDLGTTNSIGSVILYPRTGTQSTDGGSANFPVDFSVQVSTDGTNFNTVKTVTGQANPNGSPKAYNFSATNARYMKLNVTRLGSPSSDEPGKYRLQLAEIQVLSSDDLALSKTVNSSSSYETAEWGTSKLTDGITQSTSASIGYSSGPFTTASNAVNVTVDLGTSKPIGIVKLYPRTIKSAQEAGGTTLTGENPNFPIDFTIQLSTDGTNYSKVKTVSIQPNHYTTPLEVSFTVINGS
jgi:hypothetical protein